MWQQWRRHDSDNDSDEEGTTVELSPPSYIIIALDVHPSMFETDGDSQMPFRMCLEAIGKLADSVMFKTYEKNFCPFAIVLARKDNIIMRHFKSNLIETIKFINQKLEQSDDELRKEYMRDLPEPFEMSNFLLQCKKVFLDVTKTYYKRILVFFTNDDYPDCAQDAAGKFAILNEARSLSHADVTFKVITTTQHFDYSRFYKEIFEASGQDLIEEVCMDVLGMKQKLRSIVAVSQGRKRINFYVKIGDAEHSIQCYKFKPGEKARILNNAWYTTDGQQVIKAPTAPASYRYRVVNKYSVGQFVYDQGTFERKTLDAVVPYGYTFLYVTKSLVYRGEQVNPPRLLICDPRETDDMKQLFKKLWDALVSSKKVMVCQEKPYRRGRITYAELAPYLMDDEQVFRISRIPFGTQVKLPKEIYDATEVDYSLEEPEPDERITSLTKRLIEKMTEDFKFDMLVHEKLKVKKEFIKSKLFNTPLDTTGPIQYTRKQEADQKLGTDFIEEVVAVIPPRKRAQKRRRQ